MRTTTVENVARRDDVVAEAVRLLCEEGPGALTSVRVAAGLGVAQSAIYRHIGDMDELTAIASRTVVAELHSLLRSMVLAPQNAWSRPGAVDRFGQLFAHTAVDRATTFATVDRWRYVEGELGDGIRQLLGEGRELIALVLESRWRNDYGQTRPLDDHETRMQRLHAQLIQGDMIALARLARSEPHRRDVVGSLAVQRLRAGWFAYVRDLNAAHGLPAPALGWAS